MYTNTKMYVILFAVFVSTVINAETQKEAEERERQLLIRRHMLCVDESKVDPDLVIRLKANDWSIEDETLKKWLHCVLVKSDIMSEEGVLRLDVVLSKVKSADIDQVENDIDECLTMDKVGEFPYETTWNYAKCYYAKDKRYSVV